MRYLDMTIQYSEVNNTMLLDYILACTYLGVAGFLLGCAISVWIRNRRT